MKLGDIYENVFKEMCWNDTYLILGLEDKYLVNYNNNATHISIVTIHVGVVDTHTL